MNTQLKVWHDLFASQGEGAGYTRSLIPSWRNKRLHIFRNKIRNFVSTNGNTNSALLPSVGLLYIWHALKHCTFM